MTTSDKDNQAESPEEKQETAEDRLEEIKKEEQEDASSYYAQSDKGSSADTKEEFGRPVDPVDKSKEDLSLLRAVAFLGFGLAALAIVFILFFIRDLDKRVGGVDSAVKQVEKSIDPLKTDVEGVKSSVEGSQKTVQSIEAGLTAVTDTVARLKGELGDYEKSMAILELKRALAMIQGISMGSDSGIKSKSSDVTTSIQSLLNELGGKGGVTDQPAGEIQIEEAAEESVEEESGETAEESAEEEPVAEESEEAAEEPAEEESAGEESEEAMEEDGEHASEESHEEEHAESEGHGDESSSDDEELPTVEELLEEE